ncbi:MAG: sarcosine oxidase subunit alpha family protein [Gammaproteobacteria bacterium]|nr:sarcosine oxidase subunit alpha family protein [Gammaproteobacteria bacterium]
MSQINRLKEGGRIDRGRPLQFIFNGRAYTGCQGDTLASALLANNEHLVGRSFKYHRPRGIYSAGAEEPNALVQLEEGPYTEPNMRATQVELYRGLRAASQNCWPNVRFDIGVVNSWLSRIFPAGFYYKTFMWPPSLWMTYERFIRRAAGLGKSPEEWDPDRYEHRHVHCDVLIAGGGPAGIAAALAAGRSGARVVMVDEQAELGGQLLGDGAEIDGKPALEWASSCVAELEAMDEVTILTRTTCTGYYDYNYFIALERVSDHRPPAADNRAPRQRLWRIRAKQAVLATGSIERPLVFADNDRPGVMLAGALRTYINRYAVLPGRDIVVLTNNDSAYQTALDAHDRRARVEIVDTRPDPDGPLVEKTKQAGIPVHPGAAVTGVHYGKSIQGVDIMGLTDRGDDVRGPVQRIDCSVVAVSGGWMPTVHLFSQSRGKLRFDDDIAAFVPGECHATSPNRSAGACRGSFDLGDCIAEGFEAGAAAATDAGFVAAAPETPGTERIAQGAPRTLWTIPCDHPVGRGKKKHFHELQNDATVGDIMLAVREGYREVEHLKRYTTTGMGTDQGKTSNLNALGVLSELRDTAVEDLGTTTFRPPYTPLTFGAITGQNRRELFLQTRKTPMHPWHERNGAVYEDVGDWKRPWYFPRPGEDMHAAVQRECRMVRSGVGILDATTLGKIDIQGPDAVKLLNMVYTNAWNKLDLGRCRYGVMCNEHGMVFDDGVTSRIAEHHFHMTTTTGGAARVLGWLEEWLQTEWPEMRVYCTSVTEQWAVASINGPASRELLSELTDIPLDPESFPFLTWQNAEVAGVPARIFRISFTGELSFEINVPACYGLYVWEQIMAHGEKYDICPYGTESMHVLRAEKGFIIAGQDTDGSVTPYDLDMDWIVSKKKDFLGRRSLDRSDTKKPDRKQLVGLLTEDPNEVLPEGAHVVAELRDEPPMPTLGHVSSSYMSPNLGRSIAMALIYNGRNRKGEKVNVRLMDGRVVPCRVADYVFFDRKGDRARA